MKGLGELRALADVAALRGDRAGALRIHALIGRFEALLIVLAHLDAVLDAVGAPRPAHLPAILTWVDNARPC